MEKSEKYPPWRERERVILGDFLLILTNSCTLNRINKEMDSLSQGLLVFRGG